MTVRAFCISARRPNAVPAMEAQGLPLTWLVPADDAPDYRAMGASVVPVHDEPGEYNLPRARNLALDLAAGTGHVCVQTSDDLRRLDMRRDDGWATADLAGAARHLYVVLAATGAKLAGLPPTANRYFARPGVMTRGFVVGDLLAVAPSAPRFDVTLPLKEDYDFTCLHLAAYGQVARTGDMVADYRHYRNAGGAVAYRTDALEDDTAARLLARWPQYLRPNPKRAHELLVRR
jgi:hypothetical protein